MTDISQYGELETVPLNEETVAAFLRENPDFFLRQPELLAQLRIPHEERGSVSLVEIQMTRLRDRIRDLEEDITTLMSQASRNELLFRHFTECELAVMDAETLEAAEAALNKLAAALKLRVSLRLFDADGARSLDRKRFESLRANHFAGNHCYLGRLRQAEGEHFFANAPQLGSYALIPLLQGKELGVLAFASDDGGHFQPSMDTLFLDRLSRLLVRLATRQETP